MKITHWNPTHQVWIMLVGIVGEFFGAALEGRLADVQWGPRNNPQQLIQYMSFDIGQV